MKQTSDGTTPKSRKRAENPPPADVDRGEGLLAARAIIFPTAGGLVFGLLAGFYLMSARGWGWAGAALAVALGMLAGAALGSFGWLAVGGMSRGLVGLLTAAGNLPGDASFSLQESLIARGRYREAARAFAAHLARAPEDDAARLALAELSARHLGDPASAERLYREVLARQGSDGARWKAGNGLIDLFRATGQRGRLMVELARFADRYRGTPAGTAARRELDALKAAAALDPR
jgi:tetratricopeptide (TPR) repeat protein